MAKLLPKTEPQRSELPLTVESHLPNRGSSHWRLVLRSPVWRPPTDVYETEDAVVVRVEIGGMQEDDFTVELDGRYLSVRGVRPDVAERRAYHQMEIRSGEFSTEVEIPAPVNASAVEAIYDNGILRILLPKSTPNPAR